MLTLEIFEFVSFLERFQNFTNTEVEEFTSKFDTLKIGFTVLRAEVLEEARTKAPAFNVFRVLRLSRSETRTHSAMLAQLFRPDGSHEQQYLFLEGFLDCRAEKLDDFSVPNII